MKKQKTFISSYVLRWLPLLFIGNSGSENTLNILYTCNRYQLVIGLSSHHVVGVPPELLLNEVQSKDIQVIATITQI